MSTTEAILEKVNALPPEKQKKVLHYVEVLAKEQRTPRAGEPYSALRVAMSLNLDGPPDWSSRFEEYLQASRAKHGRA